MLQSIGGAAFARLLGAVILIRALYALGVWGFGVAVFAGWVVTDPVMTVFFASGPPLMLLPWLGYVLGYGAAAALLWLGRPGAALGCYASAFIVDTAIWIAYTSIRLPDVSNTVWTGFADLVTNMVDLIVLAVLALLLVRRLQARS
ncbi:hypothetical protein [Maricaulis maris]|uniref:Membrane protein YkgB n=1 Tax=Maricaulis maris TaxID=74318 RepID=A0A495DFE8_9PROT|nr:hypothetical protein [Maricaulis maris]RKR00246.1 hypothetical protein C7435_1449 [Maricaulis maris]